MAENNKYCSSNLTPRNDQNTRIFKVSFLTFCGCFDVGSKEVGWLQIWDCVMAYWLPHITYKDQIFKSTNDNANLPMKYTNLTQQYLQ